MGSLAALVTEQSLAHALGSLCTPQVCQFVTQVELKESESHCVGGWILLEHVQQGHLAGQTAFTRPQAENGPPDSFGSEEEMVSCWNSMHQLGKEICK